MYDLSGKKRIVIKLGTSTLAHRTGMLNLRRFTNLVRVIADLYNSGKEVIIVSSGAMGLGRGRLGMRDKPSDVPTKQATAAVGQCKLMNCYDEAFGSYGITVAQILLTKVTIDNEEYRRNIKNSFERLLQLGVIPIVNENDTVAIDELELEIGENDSLSAIVAELAEADLLIILSDIDGLYESDPHKDPNAKLISVVEKIDDHIEQIAGGAGSILGTGGMATKINAARIAVGAGIDMVIMNGRIPERLYDVFDNKGIGTLFKAQLTEKR